MNKIITAIFICISSFAFCQETTEKNYDTFDAFLKEQNDKIGLIVTGMTQSDVKTSMGEAIIVKIPPVGKMKALNQLFKQPEYKDQYARNPKRVVDIYWYFSTPKDQNGSISKNECTPMIFENDSLVGKGWSFLQSYRRSGKLR